MNKPIQSSLLDKINYPSDVRKLKKPQLKALSKELRDAFIEQGTREELLSICRLDGQGIVGQIRAFVDG